MKIIFLDIDGVLNFEGTVWRWSVQARQRYKITDEDYSGLYGIDPEKVSLILHVIEKTGAKFCLSSTWRSYPDWEEVMENNGLPKELFVGKTPYLSEAGWVERGKEIEMWLKENPNVERYAIIDDNNDMLAEQMPNFFQTSFKHGLTENHVNRLIEHFNKR